MNKTSISLKELKQELLADENVREEYENLKPRYEVIAQMIRARKELGMTQSELAERIGTKKSNISRFESGRCNPSLDFLIKAAQAMGKRIEVKMY